MMGTGGADPSFVPVAYMPRREQRDHRHPGGDSGRDSDRMVLDHETIRGQGAERLRHHQIDVGVRLPSREAGGAEHSVAEVTAEAQPLQRGMKPFQVARRGDGEPALRLALQERAYPLDGQNVRDSPGHQRVHSGAQGRQVDPEPALRLDGAVAVGPAEPRIALDRLFAGDRMAQRRQRFGEGGVGDDLAVDDNSVEIENDDRKPQPRSPNKAVPTRTWVAPTATAVSKSADMPMERPARPWRRASLARSAK
ncbi:MAG: hypothetical protein QOG72_2721 [Sphingomonadales bacterium]|nr:hypothetical protein [Sphingomonadales bacterium]